MGKPPVSLLYLEDNEVDRKAFLKMVRERALPYQIVHARSIAQARQALAQSQFDIIVADYHLPDGESSELFDEVKEIPFVLLTATLEEQLALRTLERGADDYLPKDDEQRHLGAVPFTIDKTLHRKNLRDREQQLTRALLEAEERHRFLVESVKDYAIYMLDLGGRVTTWNAGAERLKGYRAEEVMGRHYSLFFLPEDVVRGLPQRDLEIAAREGFFHGEGRRVRKDGSVFWGDVTLTGVKNEEGRIIGFGKVIRDITARKASDAQLQAELEREVILRREIHHRVKNNLQVISSLLYLQSSKLEDAKMRNLLRESQSRVAALALIYDRISFQGAGATGIAFGEYVDQLAKDLFFAYGAVNTGKIGLKVEADGVCLDLDTAVPCGLILTELVANALRHAFPENRSGEIIIGVQLGPENVLCLSVQDNGVGLPAGFDWEATQTMGMGVIRDLTRQLRGKVEFQSERGTIANISFPMTDPVHSSD